MSKFVHLHNHTHYSLLDAACTPEQLVKAAVADGHTALALTDHGVMFGAMEFYKKCKKAGIKPILGCEVYVANGSRFDRSSGKSDTKRKNYYHLILLVKNEIGYRNLLKLTSIGHTEGFYYKPRIDTEILAKHTEGLIALSACIGGVVNAHLVNGYYDDAVEAAAFYKELFGEDFYIELQYHGLPADDIVLLNAPKIAHELNIPMVATNDIHYIKKEHAVAHNVFLSIKEASAANSGMLDIHKLRYGSPEYYFKTADQMIDRFHQYKGAIENTLLIADKCNFDFPKKLHMPQFPIPPESKSETLEEYLEELTMSGLKKRFEDLTPEIMDRVKFELDIIKGMGFAGYFLIVQDFISAARSMGVSVGPGRGSAAGSLVAFALKITNVDPLKYDLLFERFLNPDRISMPDIDIDFNDEKRSLVIDYVRKKYGEKAVSQIITFGTLSTKAVLKDVGRVLGVPLNIVNQITAPIPTVFGKVTPLAEAIEMPELRWVKESDDPKIKELIEYSLVLEGFCRNASLHAAGVVIAPSDLDNYVPLYKTPTSELATQFNMKDLEDAGLLKMDFLGLRTLSIIDRALAMIEKNHGIAIDIDTIDLFDKKTYAQIGQGRTTGVFQFESEPMQDALRKLKPTNLEDLTAMNALYRPGPMANIPDFIDRKHGRKPIEYLHPMMESSLSKTYGIIVYQEQVMQLVRDIAGFSLAQADIMRRAMGKKDEKMMQEQKQIFIDGAALKGIDKKMAGDIFDLVLKFAAYGFNKSHSLAYSYLAYQTAWLKANYTAEFLAAFMTAELNNLDKIVQLIDEAKFFEIEVLPPDVNESGVEFTASGNTIRFGLAGIKNVGAGAVESIIKAREEKAFSSFFDFSARVDIKSVNRRGLEALICAGAFDALGIGHRAQLFEAIDSALKFAGAVAGSKTKSMDDLFGGGSATGTLTEPTLPTMPQWGALERLQKEREFLNFYISGHPLDRYRAHAVSFANLNLGDRTNPQIGKVVRVCGIITNIRKKLDKKERAIAFVTIEDFSGKAEVIFWSESYAKFQSLIQPDNLILVVGKSELQGSDALKIVADDVVPIDDAPKRYATGLHITVQREKTEPEILEKAIEILSQNKGSGSVIFSVYAEAQSPVKRYKSSLRTAITTDSALKMMNIFGAKNVKFLVD